ncbi:MAG: hypothetical protein ACE5GL_00685 [Calditrichia bacterium]
MSVWWLRMISCSMLILTLFQNGCASRNKIAGAWIKPHGNNLNDSAGESRPVNGLEIVFYKNGQFGFTGNDRIINGNYRVRGDTLEIWDDICGEAKGSYKFIEDDRDLTIFLISDRCYNRRNRLEGHWKWK